MGLTSGGARRRPPCVLGGPQSHHGVLVGAPVVALAARDGAQRSDKRLEVARAVRGGTFTVRPEDAEGEVIEVDALARGKGIHRRLGLWSGGLWSGGLIRHRRESIHTRRQQAREGNRRLDHLHLWQTTADASKSRHSGISGKLRHTAIGPRHAWR